MQKAAHQISEEVDSWIREVDLPSRANMKPLKTQNTAYLGIADPATGEWILEPMDEDEIEAYKVHQHWFMTKDYHLIMALPDTRSDTWFPPNESDAENSLTFAFTSADYARLHPDNFDKQAYRIKKIYEKVKDLADTHAAISDNAGKQNTHERYISLVEKEFRDKAIMLRESYMQNPQWVDKQECFRRIHSLNAYIRKCKEIWKKHSEDGEYDKQNQATGA